MEPKSQAALDAHDEWELSDEELEPSDARERGRMYSICQANCVMCRPD